ncbi:hypothetical protein Cgig2_008580 [Carnegiea gigantea]|uniref:Uncharacterized protein n=1 Tax=Carnegiea gigantea TaxID=171969 RepID=A0A9Q1GRD6_9CARY|nr:hypothetical protein Cgig2_008580 [Carnegiea gigantea]
MELLEEKKLFMAFKKKPSPSHARMLIDTDHVIEPGPKVFKRKQEDARLGTSKTRNTKHMSQLDSKRRTTLGDFQTLLPMLDLLRIITISFGEQYGDVKSILTFSCLDGELRRSGGNRVAHDLAHRQAFSLEGEIWEFEVPEHVLARVLDDMFTYVDTALYNIPPFSIKKINK